MSSTMQTSTLVSDNGLILFKPQDMQSVVINFLRAQNQKKSPLLKLPNELIIQIGKLVFDSDGPTRVHGMRSRNNFERNPMYLIQTCSLLRSVLQPIFLNVSAFVLQVASPTSIEVASKISKWSTVFVCATTKDVITPKIFIEITPGFGCMDAVAVNCAKHAESLAQTPTFRPKVFFNIRGATGLAYFVGSGGMMRLHPPPTDVIMKGVSNPFLYGAPPPGDWDAWKGWVATDVDDEDIMLWQQSRCKKHGVLEIFWQDDQERLKRCTGIDAN